MEMKTTYYQRDLVVSPDTVGPFITPCQQEAVTEQTTLSLSLTAVRATIEWGNEGLKDGLQEVTKGDKWSRRHFPSLGNTCLHLKGIIRQCKKAIKPTPHPDPQGSLVSGDHRFLVPLYSPICCLSLLFSVTKILYR
jgi:hypothetical protein